METGGESGAERIMKMFSRVFQKTAILSVKINVIVQYIEATLYYFEYVSL